MWIAAPQYYVAILKINTIIIENIFVRIENINRPL
jgi:hypothetical protein